MRAVWGPLGTFSPVCLESPTPETFASGGSLSSSVVLCRWDRGRLRCLKAVLLEMPLLSTVIASPSLFTWVPLGIFLRLFQSRSNSHCWGFSLSTGSFFFFLVYFHPHILYCNIPSESVATDYLKTDLVQTPVFITYSRYLEPT